MADLRAFTRELTADAESDLRTKARLGCRRSLEQKLEWLAGIGRPRAMDPEAGLEPAFARPRVGCRRIEFAPAAMRPSRGCPFALLHTVPVFKPVNEVRTVPAVASAEPLLF